jgi:iron(II)-dependent oxidoreductase
VQDETALKARIGRALDRGRRETYRLLDPLDDDALHRQTSPVMSPLVWDLGHVGNYEELWLLRSLGDASFADPRLDRVYDAFDNPRWTRSELPLLARAEAAEYLSEVRAAVLRHLRTAELDPSEPLVAGGVVYALVEQHEAQHQETMLQALDLRPEAEAYRLAADRWLPQGRAVDDTDRVTVPAGPFWMGTDDTAAALDNERPRHRVEVQAFTIDRFPVTCRRYAAFIAAGGYDRPELWTERGWEWRQESGHTAPQGWVPDGQGGWTVRRFHLPGPLDPREPVEHICWFEADAFARWAGGRLPTEAEWEKAAVDDPATGRSRRYPWGDSPPTSARANLDRVGWGPAPVGSYPAGASAYGVEQLIGDGYEWTASGFEPYPGYRTFPYPEYSEVFFGGDYRVLRGASWASGSVVARATFRNWDHPYRRQIFSGVRVAWDPTAPQTGR